MYQFPPVGCLNKVFLFNYHIKQKHSAIKIIEVHHVQKIKAVAVLC